MGRYRVLLPIAHHTIDGRSTLGGNKGGGREVGGQFSAVLHHSCFAVRQRTLLYCCKTTKIAFVSDLKVI